MGLIQVSCNPFREKRLKDINLGEISKEVISTHLDNFKNIFVPLEGIKRELEYSQDWKKMSKEEGSGYGGVGFRSSDLEAFYSDCLYENRNGENIKVEINDEIRKYMDMTYEKMDGTQRSFLEKYKIPLIELITRNSGGHPSITNVQGFSFMKYDRASMKKFYNTEKYTDVMKKFARDFTNNLKEKIKKFESGKNIEYAETTISLKGQDTNENYEFYLSDKSGKSKKVSKDDFVNAGLAKKMRPDKKSGLTIDIENRRIIAKFENFKNK